MSNGYEFFYDKMMKHIASHNLTSFFLFFGIYCLPYFPIRNEIIDKDLNRSFLDFPVMTVKGIVNLEFQLDRRKMDKKRFVRYAVQLFERYGVFVDAVVIDFKAKRDFAIPVKVSKRSEFTMYVKSLIARNPDKVLNRINIKSKIE